jgi:hypothetical protein
LMRGQFYLRLKVLTFYTNPNGIGIKDILEYPYPPSIEICEIFNKDTQVI